MATEQSTIAEYALDSNNRRFVIPFEYLSRPFVKVTLMGIERNLLTVGADYRYISINEIETTRAWGDADGYQSIELRRVTSATDRLVEFSDGSVLRSRDMNVSAIQTIHIAEEARNLASDTLASDDDGNLDARGRRLVNLGNAVNSQDAVTLGQVIGWDQSAGNSAAAAERSSIASASSAEEARISALVAKRDVAEGIISGVEGVTAYATDQAERAEQAAQEGQNAADRAEVARDAAFVNADVYPDVAAGLAAVADGEQFQVVEGDEVVRYRRDGASTATEVARLPASRRINTIGYDVDAISPYWSLSSNVATREGELADTVIDVNGNVNPSTKSTLSGYIRVKPRTAYCSFAYNAVAEFDFNQSFIKRQQFTSMPTGGPWTTGQGTHFVRCNFSTAGTSSSERRINEGGVLLPFEPHRAVGLSGVTLGADLLDQTTEAVGLTEKALELFQMDSQYTFGTADFPVRLYRSNGTIKDYVDGTFQTASEEGLVFSVSGVPVSNRYYLDLRKTYAGGSISARITPTTSPQDGNGQSVGFGYRAENGDSVLYALSDSGVVRKHVNSTTTSLTGATTPFAAGDELLFSVASGSLEITLNGTPVYSKLLDSGEFVGNLLVGQYGRIGFTFSLAESIDPIRNYVQKELVGFSPVSAAPVTEYYEYSPTEYNGRGRFRVYTAIGTGKYVGIDIGHFYDMSEIVYVDYWRIVGGRIYSFIEGVMVTNGETSFSRGESECVWRRSEDKDDFTGGVHGDEIVQSVDFFASGVRITADLDNPIALTPSRGFKYVEHSTMHETAEGGAPITGHPVECTHIKQTEIAGGGYTTRNRLTWVASGNVRLWYSGISCVGKPFATSGYSDGAFEILPFNKSGSEQFRENGARDFWGYNSDTGYSVHVTSKVILPSAFDAESRMFVTDRNVDSKYYRDVRDRVQETGDVWESFMGVSFKAS